MRMETGRGNRGFYEWQERALGGLLAWGAASIVTGAGLSRGRSALTRHAGLQAIGWGAIDLLLALNGRRTARRKAGVATPAETARDARRFKVILGVNVALDSLYVLGGRRLARASERPERRGAGIGIAAQGMFLLVYDAVLLWNARSAG